MPHRDGTFGSPLEPPTDLRQSLFARVAAIVESHSREVTKLPVAPDVGPEQVRSRLSDYDFTAPRPPESVIDDCADMLRSWTVHTTHPGYYGLFNPAPTFMGILGDVLTAAFNPQLAAWSHAPAAAEIERHLVRYFGRRLGWAGDTVAGTFTTGGAEANLTAVLLAMARSFPELATGGVRSLAGDPVFYASEASHLAWIKIAHMCGLGRDAARLVPVDDGLTMDLARLEEMIAQDRTQGRLPFLVVATAGATGTGVVDLLHPVADLCERHGLRFHVDAAWAGAAILSDELAPVLAGAERADSVTVDAHKWLSVPMGAGMFLCRDQAGLHETFRVTTGFMPASVDDAPDPYVNTVQWSRRAIGLKLFLTLATVGRTGYARQLEHDCELADVLRARLSADGWRVVNDTPLPVVCFVADDDSPAERDDWHERLAATVVSRGRAWISTVHLRERTALRACIINFHTAENDIEVLLAELAAARAAHPCRP